MYNRVPTSVSRGRVLIFLTEGLFKSHKHVVSEEERNMLVLKKRGNLSLL